jgi:hypothetical protein
MFSDAAARRLIVFLVQKSCSWPELGHWRAKSFIVPQDGNLNFINICLKMESAASPREGY